MAFSTTTPQQYLEKFASVQAKKESIKVATFAQLDELQSGFLAKGFTTFRISVVEVKLIYGWLSLGKRDELYEQCLNAGFLLVERFDELNTTFQDFFSVVFKKRQAAGLLCAIQWNGNNPGVTRPLDELIFTP